MLDHCKVLQLTNKLKGKAVTQSEKLEWWIILMVDYFNGGLCSVTILHWYRGKWLHNPPSK